jgi:hypothetical protein
MTITIDLTSKMTGCRSDAFLSAKSADLFWRGGGSAGIRNHIRNELSHAALVWAESVCLRRRQAAVSKESSMNRIIYIVGLIVVVIAVLSFFGLA